MGLPSIQPSEPDVKLEADGLCGDGDGDGDEDVEISQERDNTGSIAKLVSLRSPEEEESVRRRVRARKSSRVLLDFCSAAGTAAGWVISIQPSSSSQGVDSREGPPPSSDTLNRGFTKLVSSPVGLGLRLAYFGEIVSVSRLGLDLVKSGAV